MAGTGKEGQVAGRREGTLGGGEESVGWGRQQRGAWGRDTRGKGKGWWGGMGTQARATIDKGMCVAWAKGVGKKKTQGTSLAWEGTGKRRQAGRRGSGRRGRAGKTPQAYTGRKGLQGRQITHQWKGSHQPNHV